MLSIAHHWSWRGACLAISHVFLLVAVNHAPGQAEPDGIVASTLPESGPPVEFAAHSSSEMASVLSRLEALEQQAAKNAEEKKPADDWVDLSTEKWTVKLGGHVQLDFIH